MIAGIGAKLHPTKVMYLTRVHSAAQQRLMECLPLAERKLWDGKAYQVGPVGNIGMSLELILTHKCGYSITHKRVFESGVSMSGAPSAGKVLGNELYKAIHKHIGKCVMVEDGVPHLKIVKPWLCPICGVTDEKYPEWEGDCNHVPDSKGTKSKGKRVRARIGGRKRPAKARRKAVASPVYGSHLLGKDG